jgi:hypothetical protein
VAGQQCIAGKASWMPEEAVDERCWIGRGSIKWISAKSGWFERVILACCTRSKRAALIGSDGAAAGAGTVDELVDFLPALTTTSAGRLRGGMARQPLRPTETH